MADETKNGDENKPAVKRPTLDEGSGGGGRFLKLLVVLALLGGGGYFAYTKGWHVAVLEKFGYTLNEGEAGKAGDAGGDGAAGQAAERKDSEPPEAAEDEAAEPEEEKAEEPAPEEEKKDEPKEEEETEEVKEEKPFTGYEWVNVTPENRIGGRMVSPGYLRGKTVLIDCRDYGSRECVQDAKALQQLWSTYKTKEFVVIGCHTGEAESERVAKIMERLGLTYPIYKGAGLLGQDGEPVQMSMFTILDSTGKRFMHRGSDVRRASGMLGNLIFITKRPSGAKSWKWLLDWEIENMPGHAFNRLRDLMSDASACAEMRKKYPRDMQKYSAAYAKWQGDNEVKRTAKLVGLAVAVKDRDVNSAESKRITKATLKSAIEKYADLKESGDPRIVQEAKNAIADLTFASASLKN